MQEMRTVRAARCTRIGLEEAPQEVVEEEEEEEGRRRRTARDASKGASSACSRTKIQFILVFGTSGRWQFLSLQQQVGRC